MNDKELLRNAQLKLDEKRNALAELENEKFGIMQRVQKASAKEQKEIEKEMQESEKKYEELLAEVTEIAEKIKKIKKSICG